jgi:hypothetical protein
MTPAKWGAVPLLLGLAACGGDREPRLASELAATRAELQQASEQSRANRLTCAALAREREKILVSARQLRADTQYLTASTARLSDAVTRLNYEDWDRVVPEVQLSFSDVESAANDLDSRVGRVLIALDSDPARQR